MDNDAQKDMAALDDLLRAARTTRPMPSPDLMARIAADAQKVMPGPMPAAALRAPLWDRVAQFLGGWQGMGGLVAATCVGFWIGVSPPTALPDLGVLIWGEDATETADYVPGLSGFGWDIGEG